MEETRANTDVSVFQKKYNEFAEDLLGAVPEYTKQIELAKLLSDTVKIRRFQEEVKVLNVTKNSTVEFAKNPGNVLPGVIIEESVWALLSDNTKQAIWEHLRILTICCTLEIGFSEGDRPEWMDEIMNDMKQKLESADLQSVFAKFLTFLKPEGEASNAAGSESAAGANPFGGAGFPKLPEKFMKGHLAKLAEELVRDIKPEDLGMSPEMIEECEKSPTRAFDILLQVFSNNPGIIQSTVQKIGKRLQQKIQSGAIKPQEIAREAEELMKEFTSNTAFTELMESLKSTFGFEDPEFARAAGKEGSARLSAIRQRLQKKLDKKNQAKNGKK